VFCDFDGGLSLILSKKNDLELSESAEDFSGLGIGHPAFAHNLSVHLCSQPSTTQQHQGSVA
jgi:hypothetical protein